MNHDDVIAALSAIRDRESGDINVILPPVRWDFLIKNGYICPGQRARYILTFLGHVKLAAEKDKNETS